MSSSSLAIEAPRHAVPPGDRNAGPGMADPHAHDILTTAEGSPRLGVFVDFMRAAGLAHVLLDEGPFTVFAPTDRAFMKLSLRDRDALLADFPRLSRTMRGHVIAGKVLPPMQEPMRLTTLDGAALRWSCREDTTYVGEGKVVQANIVAANGIIHAIDSVLL